MGGRGRALAIAAAALVVLVLGWSYIGRDVGPDAGSAPVADTEVATVSSDPDVPSADDTSPFAPSDEVEGEASARPSNDVPASTQVTAAPAGNAAARTVAPLGGPVDVTALGREPLSDDAFDALVARLADDPELFAALVDEFRSETDPQRLARLAQLLGEVGGAEVTALAAELVYSGDVASRELGLDLLRRVQPGNAEARDIVAGLLSTETQAETLRPTLQALARPGVVAPAARADLASRVALLSAHEDAGVRRLGMGILSRWSDGETHTPVFLDALADGDAGVREAAAYALVGRDDPDGTAARGLFAVIENDAEADGTRRAAMLALNSLPLDDSDRVRAAELQERLDRRPR